MLGMLRQFHPGHDVDISTLSGVSYPEIALFPRYAYKQVAANIGGTAYYHDLGKFIADFENPFKHMRIHDVSMEPPAVSQADREKLTFKIEIVALVKSNSHP